MAQGQTTRNILSMRNPDDVSGTLREIKRWGDRLPIASTGFHYVNSADQAVGAGATANLAFNTKVLDRERWGGTVTTTFICPPGLSGLYVLNAGILLAAALVGQWLTICVNGVSIGAAATNGVVTDHVVASGVSQLKERDVITCQLFNQAGGISTSASFAGNNLFPRAPFLSAWRISLL